VAKQMPDAEKRRRADIVIETGDGLDAARVQVRAALRRVAPEAFPDADETGPRR